MLAARLQGGGGAQRLGGRHAVAVLEPDRGELREGAVVQLERRLRVLEMLDRRVLEAGLLVVEHEVTLREGAALGVLSFEAYVDAVGQQRAEGEGLGLAAVDPAFLQRLDPARQRAPQLAVDVETLGRLQRLLVDRPQLLGRHGGVDGRAGGPVEEVPGLGGAGDGRVLGVARRHLLAQPLQRDFAQVFISRLAFGRRVVRVLRRGNQPHPPQGPQRQARQGHRGQDRTRLRGACGLTGWASTTR